MIIDTDKLKKAVMAEFNKLADAAGPARRQNIYELENQIIVNILKVETEVKAQAEKDPGIIIQEKK